MYQPIVEPDFRAGVAGALFELNIVPPDKTASHVVLFVAPFAEEMNKSRKMMTELLIGAAGLGMTGVLFDFYGTGDSEGEFEQATWKIWVEDLNAKITSLISDSANSSLSIVSLRTGALLVNDTLNQLAPEQLSKIKALHYWNPVLNASQFVSQFLRLKLAADMVKSGAEKVTAKDLRQQLRQHGYLEVAGYRLNNALFEGLEQATLALPANVFPCTVNFYEISALDGITPALSIGIKKILQDNREYQTFCINDAPFWSTQEIAISKQLLDITTEHLLKNKGQS